MQSIMIIGVFLMFSLLSMILVGIGTTIASKQPKKHPFRKWWVKHICALDEEY